MRSEQVLTQRMLREFPWKRSEIVLPPSFKRIADLIPPRNPTFRSTKSRLTTENFIKSTIGMFKASGCEDMSKDIEKVKEDLIENDLRERLVRVARELWEDGLVRGSAGNISAKIPGTKTCLIKPSGYRFKELQKDHFLVVNYETREVVKGTLKPSIETPFHTGIYKVRPDVGGVVHTHATTLVGFSAAGIPIVPVYMGAMMGVPIAGWHFPGTEELAEDAIKTLGDGSAVMIKHHGVITVGPTIERASNLTISLEEAAKAQLVAHMLGRCETIPYDDIEKRVGSRPRVSLPE